MTTQPSAPGILRLILCGIAVLAAPTIGVGYLQGVSPPDTLTAECENGQTLDPATGTCPPNPYDNPDWLEFNGISTTPPGPNVLGCGGGGYMGISEVESDAQLGYNPGGGVGPC